MILSLETKKLKRTGYLPAFLCGGLLAAAFPFVNMLVRSETFTSLPGNPFAIMLDANWQMMAMINILMVVCGTCVMYHTEYADNGAQKMDVLPLRSGSLFFGKFAITALTLAAMILIETLVLVGCVMHWFPASQWNLLEVAKGAGFQWIVTLPTVMLMLVVASACKNMWISLGIGVILVFILSILPQGSLVLNLLPFRSPYQTLGIAAENDHTLLFLAVCGSETVLLGMAELLYQKVRRCYE